MRDAPEFVWTGDDPTDEVACRSVPGYVCHCECMAGPTAEEPDEPEVWYCSVGREPRTGDWRADNVFHSGEWDVVPLTGKAARRLCETAVLADLYRGAV